MAGKKQRTESPPVIVEDEAERVPSKPPRKVVETKTITYEEPELEIEDTESASFEFDEKPYRRAAKSERVKNKERWQKKRGATGAQYRVRIDRLPMFDQNGQTGVNAERKFVKSVNCNAKFIDDEDYLETIRGMIQTGQTLPGAFWISVYDSIGGVDQWTEFVDGVMPSPQIIQHSNPNDPASPQIVVQMPDGHQQTVQPFDPVKQMREHNAAFKLQLENIKLMREAFGVDPIAAQNGAQPQLSEEVQVASLLLKDPTTVKKMMQKLTGDESEQTLTASLLEHGPSIIKAAGDVIRSIIADFAAIRGNNGTSQMGVPIHAPIQSSQVSERQNGQGAQAGLQTAPNYQSPIPSIGHIGNGAENIQSAQGATVTPQDELLYLLIDACEQNAPIADVCSQINLAIVRWPELGDSVDALINLPSHQLLTLATSLRPSLASAPHAEAWLESLMQALTQTDEYESTGN